MKDIYYRGVLQGNSNEFLSKVDLCNIVQDTSTTYLKNIKLNNTYLNEKYGIILIVLRNKIEFLDKIVSYEKLVVSTKIIRKNPLSFVEVIEIKNGANDLLLVSTIEICGINMNTREVADISKLKEYQNIYCVNSKKITYSRFNFNNLTKGEEDIFTIKEDDIDYSRHLNNVVYIKYLLKFLRGIGIYENKIKVLEINYVKEVLLGETIEISSFKDDENVFLISCKNNIAAKIRIEK